MRLNYNLLCIDRYFKSRRGPHWL